VGVEVERETLVPVILDVLIMFVVLVMAEVLVELSGRN